MVAARKTKQREVKRTEELLRKIAEPERAGFVLEQIKKGDHRFLIYEKKTGGALTQIIKRLVNERTRRIATLLPDLRENHFALQRRYAAIGDADSHCRELDLSIDSIKPSFFRNTENVEYEPIPVYTPTQISSSELELQRQTLLYNGLEVLMKGFDDIPDKRTGRPPSRMDVRRNYTVEHSLHTARILIDIMPNLSIGGLLTGLFHDYVEDVHKDELMKGNYEEVKRQKLEEMAESLGANTETVHPSLRKELHIMKNAVGRMTIRAGNDYTGSIDSIFADRPEDEGKDKRELALEKAWAIAAKLADKISSVQNIAEKYDYHKILRLHGKAWTVLNAARHYLNAINPEDIGKDLYEGIRNLTVQTGISMRKSLREQSSKLEQDMNQLYGRTSMKRSKNDVRLQNRLNSDMRGLKEYVSNGGLKSVDRATGSNGDPNYDQTLYNCMLFGLHLNTPGKAIPQAFMIPEDGRDIENARQRLLKERKQAAREIPREKVGAAFTTKIKAYRERLKKTDRPKKQITRMVRERTEAVCNGYFRLRRRFIALERLATLYTLDETFAQRGFETTIYAGSEGRR